MKSSSVSLISRSVAQATDRINRFARCESGATTADFVIIASVAVSMAVGVVTTTKGGASVTANNTVAAIEAQDPMFSRLSSNQQAVRDEMAANSTGGSNYSSGSQGYNGGATASISGSTQPGGSSTGESGQSETSDQASSDQESAGQDTGTETESADNTATESTESETSTDQSTETAAADTATEGSDGGGSSGGGGLPTGNEEPEEEEEVAEVSVPEGCENPYNKQGKIKRKCR